MAQAFSVFILDDVIFAVASIPGVEEMGDERAKSFGVFSPLLLSQTKVCIFRAYLPRLSGSFIPRGI
jgi:hypothetical protein